LHDLGLAVAAGARTRNPGADVATGPV